MLSEAMAITAANPAQAVQDAVESIRTRFGANSDRSRFAVGPLVVFIVAAAILLALALTLSAAVVIYCINQGGDVTWYTKNGWKVWEFKVACTLH